MPESSEQLIAALREKLAEVSAREGEFRLKCAQDILELEKRVHLKQIELKEAVQALHADVEAFTWMLEKAEDPAPPAATPDAPPAKFVYYLHTSPFRIYRGERFTLRGWVFPEDGRKVTGIRARVDDREYAASIGLPEPEVIARHGPQANNPQPGFEVGFETPPGRHRLRLDAQIEGRKWFSILALPIWTQRSS